MTVSHQNDREVLAELKRREPLFHRPEVAGSRAELENMMVEDFSEVGASGRAYSRQYVLRTVAARAANPVDDPWETRDFHCRELAPHVYLLTYTLLQGERTTRRATIWRRDPSGWKAVYHQGTVVREDG
jgi:hypothetical protein